MNNKNKDNFFQKKKLIYNFFPTNKSYIALHKIKFIYKPYFLEHKLIWDLALRWRPLLEWKLGP